MRLSVIAALSFLILGLPGCSREAPAPEPTAQPAAEQPAEPSGQPAAAAAEPCRLTMGWDPWEPYHYLDPAGEERGLDVDLVSAIAGAADCQLAFERDNWASLLNRVAAGEVDLITGATQTEERDVFARFSEPYRQETFVLFTRVADADRFAGSTLEAKLDAGMRIGVTDGYLYGEAVEALRDNPDYAEQFVSSVIGETNATRLIDGEIDGFLEDRFVAAAALRRRGLEDDISGDLVVSSSDVRLMFSKASVDQALVDRLDDGMAALRAAGEFDAIQSRYLR